MADVPGAPSTSATTSGGAAFEGQLAIAGDRQDQTASGTYQVGAQASALPVWNIDQIAAYLISGEGTGDMRRWDVSEGGTLTVNLTGMTETGQYLAREALALYSDMLGITFAEVTSGGDIYFDDTAQNGGFMDGSWTDGIFQYATVYVGPNLVADGAKIGGIGFQVLLHEIGHALGLGHGGPYDASQGVVDYATDALYANDGFPMTIMSYFNQVQNTYFADQGFSMAIVGSPMVADYAAIQLLYGSLSTQTRTGDTTYGFNSNAGRDSYNAALNNIAYTVFDSGGVDTLDYSGSGANQRLDLNEGAHSNVLGLTSTVAIAYGTVIENAIGGSGNDQLIGNAANNVLRGGGGADALTGGGGTDTFLGTAAELSGDTIVDLALGERIVISDATLSSFTHSLSGSTLTYSGGSLTFGTAPTGTLVASAVAGGGVQLTLSTEPPPPPPVSRAKLILTESGQDVTIGGAVAVLGTTAGGEVIEVVRGDVTLDASFNAGGDTVVLPGNAGTYTAVLSGSFVTIAGGGVSVAIPVGTAGLAVQFADSTRTLEIEGNQVVLGTQAITATQQPIATSGPPLVDAVETGPDSFAKLILTAPGQDVDIGGTVSITGMTASDETITVLGGTIQLDASFNAGGDIVVMPGPAGEFGATLSGSFVTIADGDTSVAIPVGLAGLMVDFDDANMNLRIEGGEVMLGEDVVTQAAAQAQSYRLDFIDGFAFA